ncbi:D-aminoacyl-tRNA deacylase [Tepidiforma sp.]|uniref:D-aminoacyl-tRNA deacylase n=1 Tax=Tepidiforma sp. TaxID=2682230 RepID=UPI002ADE1B1F|nr:D-aminoacyl-tRNA deacylase [Tepidiforma sp.]
MRAVVQRVTRAQVSVHGRVIGSIGRGAVVLVGVAREDTAGHAARLARKVAALRIFDDAEGRMNLDAAAAGGAFLCVSQFTLYGDLRRGNRPSWERAAPPELARPLFDAFVTALRETGVPCESGEFGAEMLVELVNDGPVTLILDTDDLERPRRA